MMQLAREEDGSSGGCERRDGRLVGSGDLNVIDIENGRGFELCRTAIHPKDVLEATLRRRTGGAKPIEGRVQTAGTDHAESVKLV
jgi:hypothetical protein